MSKSIPKTGQILLDANCAIAIMSQLPAAREFFSKSQSYIPAIVVGELMFGAYNSNRREENLARLSDFLKYIPVLNCNSDTAEWYAKVRYRLLKIGRPIPANDMWIAAIALQNNLPIASKDRHFDYVEGIERIEW